MVNVELGGGVPGGAVVRAGPAAGLDLAGRAGLNALAVALQDILAVHEVLALKQEGENYELVQQRAE